MPQSWESVLAFGDRLTPGLRRELLTLFRETQDRIPVSALVTLIEHHGLTPTEVARVLEQFPARLAAATQGAIQQGTTGAARIAQTDLAGRLQVAGRLDLVNIRAVQAAQQQAAQLVTRVTMETRQAIQTIVAVSIQSGIAPRDAARLIRQVIGLNARQTIAASRFQRRLLESGVAAQRAEDLTARYAAKLLRQRATMIARTEIIDSLTSGQQATWIEAQQRGLLPPSAKQRWVITPDDRLCPICAQMVGERALAPIGGVFDTPLGPRRGPTLHPHCRCAVTLDTASLSLRIAA
jgi:hypothetical protein